jgi:hypothetical protein
MSKKRTRRNGGDRLPPFVPLLKETLASPAWRAMSHSARSLYIALKLRYSSNLQNNGRIYLSQRDAADELGSSRAYIGRWFRELQHYGFAVMTQAGCLGVDGRGKAPHWRLTECGYMNDPPTRDFIRWDGGRFQDRRRRPKKQNPGLQMQSTLSRKCSPPVSRKCSPPAPKSVSQMQSIQDAPLSRKCSP